MIMGTGRKTVVDITPDKSLIQKLGLAGYRTEQAISELIDNSIDARYGGRAEGIDVTLDFAGRTISVADDGAGMDVGGLRGGLTIAKAAGPGDSKLGRYGLGMKSACSALGRSFSIVTTSEKSDREHLVQYDEREWLNDESMTWKNFEVASSRKARPWSGTTIQVSDLKVPLYTNQASAFRKSFGIRYGEYIRNGMISLRVNGRECSAEDVPVEEGSRRELQIELPGGGRIRGWIGLLKKRSVRGDYGMHLYKNNRLIRAFDKFGIRPHPSVSRMVGRVDLDHVPVNFHKTGFIEDSPEFREAREGFRTCPDVADMVKRSTSRQAQAPSVASVISRLAGDAPGGRIRSRMSAAGSRDLLRGAGEFRMRAGGQSVDVVFEDGGKGRLYGVEAAGDGYKITINRESPVFGAVGNPLFLIGMVCLEAGEILKDPKKYDGFLTDRNASWCRFVERWSQRRPAPAGRRAQEAIILPEKYSLVAELLDLHDHLKEGFEFGFQFTALSTLSPFLHNAYRTTTYNLETVRGAGQLLHDMILDYAGGRFRVFLNPRSEQAKLMKLSEGERFIIIREFSRTPTATWASPAKAWADMLAEMRRDTLQISDDEPGNVLDYMLESDLVKEEKVRAAARHKNILPAAEWYLDRAYE